MLVQARKIDISQDKPIEQHPNPKDVCTQLSVVNHEKGLQRHEPRLESAGLAEGFARLYVLRFRVSHEQTQFFGTPFATK